MFSRRTKGSFGDAALAVTAPSQSNGRIRPFSSGAHHYLTRQPHREEEPTEGDTNIIRNVTMMAVAVGSLVLPVLAAAPAHAEERTCRGTIGAVRLDNVRVPQGATCTLDGTRVQGTVKVEGRATLRAIQVRVIGNVQAENARRVLVRGSSVGGSIQHVQGGSANVRNNRVTGDVQMFSNDRAITINRNHIDGNLQCKSNNPAPTGGGNVVDGNKEDQCRTL